MLNQITRRGALLGTASAVTAGAVLRPARAQSNVIRVGVMNDQSGPYRDTTGVLATRRIRLDEGR